MRQPKDPAVLAAYLKRLDEDVTFFVQELWYAIGSQRETGDGTLIGKAPLTKVEFAFIGYITDPSYGTIRGALATRGFGKTYLESAAVACWRLYRDHRRKIVIISKGQQSINRTSTLIRGWIGSVWFLNHLLPRKGQRDSVTAFDIGPGGADRQPSVSVLGISGQLESNRGHTVIFDDCETKANSITFESRDRLWSLISDATNWLYPSMSIEAGECRDPMEILHTLTPKHEETYARRLEEELGVTVFAFPLCAPMPDEHTFTLHPTLQGMIDTGEIKPGECFLSHRFTPADVALRRMNRSEWLRENQLVRTLGDADQYPLKLENFIVYDSDGPTAPLFLQWGKSHNDQSTACQDVKSHGIGSDSSAARMSSRSPCTRPLPNGASAFCGWAAATSPKMRRALSAGPSTPQVNCETTPPSKASVAQTLAVVVLKAPAVLPAASWRCGPSPPTSARRRRTRRPRRSAASTARRSSSTARTCLSWRWSAPDGARSTACLAPAAQPS